MSTKRPLFLALAAAVTTLATQAPAQGTLPPGWFNPSPPYPYWQDPRFAHMLRLLEERRRMVAPDGPAIPVPPLAEGDVPDGVPHRNLAELFQRMRPYQPVTAPVDGNHDGIVSDEEAASHAEAVFAALDMDGDRSLSPAEIDRRSLPVMFAVPEVGEEPELSDRFVALDGNGDGAVSKSEFLDVAHAHYEAARDPASGEVTPWSYRRRDLF